MEARGQTRRHAPLPIALLTPLSPLPLCQESLLHLRSGRRTDLSCEYMHAPPQNSSRNLICGFVHSAAERRSLTPLFFLSVAQKVTIPNWPFYNRNPLKWLPRSQKKD